METLKLSLENTNGVVTILEGQAPKQAEQSRVVIKGNIKAVQDYLTQRELDKNNSHIEADKQNGTIKLFQDASSSFGVFVEGKIEMNAKLAELGINKDKKYTPKELVKVLKFNKFLFDSPIEVDAVIAKVQKLQIKVTSQIGKTQATQSGSIDNQYSKTVESDLHSLVLNCEVYSGSDKVKFTTEIWLDVEGQNVQYWFESVTLAELEVNISENLVDSVLESIKQIEGFDLPIIIK